MITANRRASATIAFFMPRCLAIFMAQALSQDHFAKRTSMKTLRSQKLRMLLTHRELLQSKAIAIDNDLRGTLRNFGLKVGVVGTVKFEARIKELVESSRILLS